MGIRALRKVQFGIETTAGTLVAADSLWRGTGVLKDTRNVVFVKEDIGYLGGTNRSYVPKLGGTITLAAVEATYEQLPVLLTCGVEALTTGAADTSAGAGKIYTYTMATTAVKTPSTLTIETGDDSGAEVAEYCFVDTLNITGKAGEAVMMSADFIGRQVVPQAFTGGLAPVVVEEILCSKGLLYIDAITGTAGTTLKSNTLLGFDFSLKTGFQAVQTADGNLYFSFVKQVAPEPKLTITFEHDASAIAQKVLYRAGTAAQIQLKFTGSVISTVGTYLVKTLKITLAGIWTEFSVLDEQDGNDICTGTFIPKYDVTNSKAPLSFVVANALTALP